MSKYSSAAESRLTGGGYAVGLVVIGGLLGRSLAADRGLLLFCVVLGLECKRKTIMAICDFLCSICDGGHKTLSGNRNVGYIIMKCRNWQCMIFKLNCKC